MSKPIDPMDEYGLKDAYNAGVESAHQQGIPSTQHWQGLVSVARAVLPDGYVAVPVAEIKHQIAMISQALWPDATRELDWILDEVRDALYALIPTEATDE